MSESICIICGKSTSVWVVYHGKSGFCKCRDCAKTSKFNEIVFAGEYRHCLDSGESYVSISASPNHVFKTTRVTRLLRRSLPPIESSRHPYRSDRLYLPEEIYFQDSLF